MNYVCEIFDMYDRCPIQYYPIEEQEEEEQRAEE